MGSCILGTFKILEHWWSLTISWRGREGEEPGAPCAMLRYRDPGLIDEMDPVKVFIRRGAGSEICGF